MAHPLRVARALVEVLVQVAQPAVRCCALGVPPVAQPLVVRPRVAQLLVVQHLVVLRRVVQMVSDRRSQSAGSRLHLRLTGVFAIVALIPTVLVAVFGV